MSFRPNLVRIFHKPYWYITFIEKNFIFTVSSGKKQHFRHRKEFSKTTNKKNNDNCQYVPGGGKYNLAIVVAFLPFVFFNFESNGETVSIVEHNWISCYRKEGLVMVLAYQFSISVFFNIKFLKQFWKSLGNISLLSYSSPYLKIFSIQSSTH